MEFAAAKIEGFEITGITQIVSNERGQAVHAINGLWTRFYNESIVDKIEQKQGVEVYAVYSDYEGDHTKPYRVTIGCKTAPGAPIAAGLHRTKIAAQNYAAISSTGDQPQALIDTWQSIWDSSLNRSFITDFEVYGPRFFEPGLHEVMVYIGIK